MNNKEPFTFQEPYRGRFGSEETPHGSARERRSCGTRVVPDNPNDVARSLTKNRARRVPSPRAVRLKFPETQRGQFATTGANL